MVISCGDIRKRHCAHARGSCFSSYRSRIREGSMSRIAGFKTKTAGEGERMLGYFVRLHTHARFTMRTWRAFPFVEQLLY